MAERHTAWTFGELPELMELKKGGQVLIGFPALIDRGTHVEVEVFDEPAVAAARHRAGLRRLVALQLREPLKYLEKNIPDLQKMAAAYMGLGTLEELREQIIEVALDRAFLVDPLPTDAAAFKAAHRRRPHAAEPDRRRGRAPGRHGAGGTGAAQRKLKDSKPPREVADDVGAQLQRLCPKRFWRRPTGRRCSTCRAT
jgi:ATP-dependent helicase HrpA